ncbi:CLUMA_CG001421, isoform A [Clunio marinus]|uniref:CLUMA_CG001421, isoform A n=1 Tax=Clunio marinus TaxID=568069 RepID=A0A1J1HN13_9DIPT|nr:CLUMA_CG001421, isoform A [Clunio marinus]
MIVEFQNVKLIDFQDRKFLRSNFTVLLYLNPGCNCCVLTQVCDRDTGVNVCVHLFWVQT